MIIKARVTAGARRESCVAQTPERFEIAVKEPAERNAANARVRALVAAHFRVPAQKVRIVRGHHAPAKTLTVALPS